MTDLDDFADKYFGADAGKSVPLGLLRAWLSEHHWHPEPFGELDPFEEYDSRPVVHSMDLDRWARDVAVTRVVDRDEEDVWSFFEHGWHKAGPACEAHLMQSQARLVRGTFPDDVATFIRSGQVRGMSIIEGELPEHPHETGS